MRLLCSVGSFCRSAATYALLLFGLSVLAIFLTVWGMPEPLDQSEEAGVVTRADSWPVSKRTHMEEDDLWYRIESRTSSWVRRSTREDASKSSNLVETPPLAFAQSWVPGVTEYHELEILIWCLLLPGLVFSTVGAGIAAHRSASRAESLLAMSVLLPVLALGLSYSTDELYIFMWDASIHWANWLGLSYYDFTVRFFVVAPLVTGCVGTLLLLERGRRMIFEVPSS